MPKNYVRIVFKREKIDGPEILLQKLAMGKLVFPGGECEKDDKSTISSAIRELSEETEATSEALELLEKQLIAIEPFIVTWVDNKDYVFTVSYNDLFSSFQLPNKSDVEIVSSHWIPLKKLISGEYDHVIFNNIKETCLRV